MSDSNTGHSNTGHRNTGHSNTGHSNTGHSNTGHSNTCNWNTGNWNTGHSNTGHRNTGNWNTGNWNTGHSNTGHSNTGHRNTGNSNTGHRNTGSWNTGSWNTGSWNTGNWNTGYFCENDGPVMFFDLPCSLTREEALDAIPYVELPVGAKWTPFSEMTDDQKTRFPNAQHIGGCLEARTLSIQEAMSIAWKELDVETKRRFLALPNFDADKFQRITGVDVTADADLYPQPKAAGPKEIVVDGVRYVRAE